MRYMNLLSALTLTLQYSTLGYRARSKSSNLGAVTTDRQTDLDAFTHALESRDELRAGASFLRQTVNQLRQLRLQTTTFAPTSTTPTPPTTPSLTRCRPGGGETICPPPAPMAVRRWQKSRRIYVRPRTGPQSAHLWRQTVAKLQAASVPVAQAAAPWDRQTDGSRYRLMPPYRRMGA